ncbi:YbaK/EbsC family protein [Permianibacter aggregans]|uniref:Prolyl-tRNA editing enzyme YbaK/EbsC (Cys-tRNA(Pro) deacylase) n=1 Tax=Permianibacter aggregans TaxID=1510150 RepID=A0A4R6UGJ2_9GAMM|nr:YbaK/EbsC family protein [Permianibacter aggregans]QGX39816.1 YbaK/EbsC family protein [Permianibacter aggregans]TDQ45908.1 prolyl-tRNA editing enzyme YbaK/EbsC (Cys-tRNA(Pro) deacylase) [Permianibacter aggregans]
MNIELSRSAQKIRDVLNANHVETAVIELPASTRTAAEAAQAIGCTVAQIAKSIIFRGAVTGKAVLVVASGINRINENKVSALIGEPLAKADAAFVREKTGFVIGGVPPIGHIEKPITIVDEDILRLGDIWAAAGTPNSVFRLTGELLVQLSGGLVAAIK